MKGKVSGKMRFLCLSAQDRAGSESSRIRFSDAACRGGMCHLLRADFSLSSIMASLFSDAHSISALRWGSSERVRRVSAYSTLGGTSG